MARLAVDNVLRLAAAVMIVALCATGCAPPVKEEAAPLAPAKGKQNIYEAVAALNAHRQRIGPFRAGGNAVVEWYESDGTKHKENPAIQLRLAPPDRLFFMGEILGNEVVRFGTNPREFWFRIKPKEVSSYWWGLRETARKCHSGGVMNPESVLEALGIVDVDTSWQFFSREDFDVLTLVDQAGVPVKRVFVDWRDYLVRRIEYYNVYGDVTAVASMGGYGENTDGIGVPTQVDIVYLESVDGSLSISMVLRDVKRFEPTEAQLTGKLFSRPETEGFENVYVLADNCEFVRAE